MEASAILSSDGPRLIEVLLNEFKLRPGGAAWRQLAKQIGILARGHPYSWRYVQSIFSGSLPLSTEFRSGAYAALAKLDGGSALIAKAEQLEIYALDPEIAGSLVMGHSAICSCGLRFVPNVPWRKNCPECSPPR